MRRRSFVKNTGASMLLAGMGGMVGGGCSRGEKHLTILHTNDVHSHIEPFPPNHSDYANLGGVARRAALIANIRRENPHTLLFDAGDIFQGTPYFNFYGGELEFKLMARLGYDAATIGNHDFDNGLDGLYAQLPHADFKLLSANYDFGKTIMDGHVKPYELFQMAALKIGVYGLGIKLDGLVTPKLYKETAYLDPFEVAQDVERTLMEDEGCDLIVCLSHLGYDYLDKERPSDLQIAAATRHTDLIIGGHTHTFLERPSVVDNLAGHRVIVNQVGCFGINLGRIDFYFGKNKDRSAEGISIQV